MSSGDALPPIIFTNKDQEFLKGVYSEIQESLECLTHINQKSFYTIYKLAFQRVIDYVTSYSRILTAIKVEYESLIEAVERGQQEERNLSNKIEELTYQPSTLENYRKYMEELESKRVMLERECAQLEEKVQEMSAPLPSTPEPVELSPAEQAQLQLQGRGPLPGMSVASSMDYESLIVYRTQLEAQLKELRLAVKTRFLARERQVDLLRQLENVYARQSSKQKEVRDLLRQFLLLKAAQEATQEWRNNAVGLNLEEALVKGLRQARYRTLPRWLQRGGAEDDLDDPMEMEEDITTGYGEMPPLEDADKEDTEDDMARYQQGMDAMKCTQLFMRLIEEKHYREAAVLAAGSPQGCLVHMRTFQSLREVEERDGRELAENCVMVFCERLLSLSGMRGRPPASDISFECVRCTLERDEVRLISHWVTNRRLTFSEALGDLLKTYAVLQETASLRRTLHELAGVVYAEVEADGRQVSSSSHNTRSTVQSRHSSISSTLSSTLAIDSNLLLKAAECWIMCERMRQALGMIHPPRGSTDDFLTRCRELYSRVPYAFLGRHLMKEGIINMEDIALVCQQSQRLPQLVELLEQLIQEEKEKDPSATLSELLVTLQLERAMSWKAWHALLQSVEMPSSHFLESLRRECAVKSLLSTGE